MGVEYSRNKENYPIPNANYKNRENNLAEKRTPFTSQRKI
jgi:hypothetical protein